MPRHVVNFIQNSVSRMSLYFSMSPDVVRKLARILNQYFAKQKSSLQELDQIASNQKWTQRMRRQCADKTNKQKAIRRSRQKFETRPGTRMLLMADNNFLNTEEGAYKQERFSTRCSLLKFKLLDRNYNFKFWNEIKNKIHVNMCSRSSLCGSRCE